jgi:uncharacterized membrane protein
MYFFQAISVFFVSCVKFFLAIPLAHQYDFSFWETFLLSCFGGLVGVLIFARFRKVVLKIYYRFFPYKPKNQRKESLKRTLILSTARKYGLFGIAFLTPVFLSIPIGTFVALHFFPNQKKTLPVLFASVMGWSFLLTLIWNI